MMVSFVPQYFQQPFLKSHDVSTASLGLFLLPARLTAATVSMGAHRVEARFGGRTAIALAPVVGILVCFGLAAWDSIYAFALVSVAAAAGTLRMLLISHYINSRIPSEQRATILSIFALAAALFPSSALPVCGYLADEHSLRFLYGAVAVFCSLTLPFILLFSAPRRTCRSVRRRHPGRRPRVHPRRLRRAGGASRYRLERAASSPQHLREAQPLSPQYSRASPALTPQLGRGGCAKLTDGLAPPSRPGHHHRRRHGRPHPAQAPAGRCSTSSLRDLLPAGSIVGYARTSWSDADFQQAALESVREFGPVEFDERVWKRFAARLSYVPAGDGLDAVKRRLTQPQRLVYLSVPASAFRPYVDSFVAADLVEGTRLVIEKPFGHDHASAVELNASLHEHSPSRGSSASTTISAKRRSRTSSSFVSATRSSSASGTATPSTTSRSPSPSTSASKAAPPSTRRPARCATSSRTTRCSYWPCWRWSRRSPTSRRQSATSACGYFAPCVRPLPATAVRGQYTAGKIDGVAVPGYREEPGVSPHSTTETYAALELEVDNWRWAGVPFFVRTGKRLPLRDTEISICFKDVPKRFFEEMECADMPQNLLRIEIQPEEAVKLTVLAKIPGPEINVKPVDMEFSYGHSFMAQPAEAYERLIHDAMSGDQTLFARADGVERAWQILQPVLDSVTPGPPIPRRLLGPAGGGRPYRPAPLARTLAPRENAGGGKAEEWSDHRPPSPQSQRSRHVPQHQAPSRTR